jgi:ketosteroid isomerase-like protein
VVSSYLEALAPLFELFPTERITSGDEETRQRLEDALREVAHPDVESAFLGPDRELPREHRGIEGFIEGWAEWLSAFERFRVELEDVIESGDCMVTLVRLFGAPRGTAAEIENAGAAVWWFRDGKLTRVEFHLSREEGLRAAGLDS